MKNDNRGKESSHQMMADINEGDRPREKALAYGLDSLSDAELLAILFNTGIKNVNVVAMSEAILADNDGHLSRLVKMSVGDIVARYKARLFHLKKSFTSGNTVIL